MLVVLLVLVVLCGGIVDSSDALFHSGHGRTGARHVVMPLPATAVDPFSPLPACLAEDARKVAGYLHCLRHVAHELGINNAVSVRWDAEARAIRVLDASNTTLRILLWPGLSRVPSGSVGREPRQPPLFEGCLFQACEPPPPPLPPVGRAALSLDARLRSRGETRPRSSRFELLVHKLQVGMAVHVLAAGASPTAMFASGCMLGKCLTGLPMIAHQYVGSDPAD